MDGRKIIKYILALAGIVVVIGYSYFALGDFVRGPRIIISSPETGFSTTTPVITIVGRAIHINTLTVNGDATPLDLEGNFSSRLILAPGYNIIKVTAKDRYERTVEKEIEITLLHQANSSSMVSTATTTPDIQIIFNF